VGEFQRVVRNVKQQCNDAPTDAAKNQVKRRAVRALESAGFDDETYSSDADAPQRKKEFPFITARDLSLVRHAETEWPIDGFAAKGGISMVVGKPKVGKTTLALGMGKSLVDGANFVGRSTRKSGLVAIVEQPQASYHQALERAGLLDSEDVVLLFWSDVIGKRWAEVAAAATEECIRRGFDVLLVDTLHQVAGLVGDRENNAGDCLSAVQPLQEAAAKDLAVLFTWHERKGGGEISDAGRGSSAVAGAVDVILSLRMLGGNHKPTLREIRSLSRFAETPGEMVIELEGDRWVDRGTSKAIAKQEARKQILDALPLAEESAPNFEELMSRLEEGVKPTVAREMLKDLSGTGEIRRLGKGVRNNPFRYLAPVPEPEGNGRSAYL